MKLISILFLYTSILLISSNFHAQDGTLDNSFGTGGKVSYIVSDSTLHASTVQVQADGKIVVGGGQSDINQMSSKFIVLRYNSNGSFDNTFGVNGKVDTNFGSQAYFARVSSLAIQDDGKIIAMGSHLDGNGASIVVARYENDGSLDNSFGIGGKILISNSAEPQVIKIQSDGKILLLTSASGGNVYETVVFRLNIDGSLDNSFSGDGIAEFSSVGDYDFAKDVAIQSDGKIVVCGETNNSALGSDVLVFRINTDGTLDTSFDSDGIQTTDYMATNQNANAIAIQSDGKIVTGGWYVGGSFIMTRYNTDGTLDTSFDSDGVLVSSFGYQSEIEDLLIQNNGKIVIAGSGGFAIARLNSDGSFDTSFDNDGMQTTNIGLYDDYAYALAKQVDGKFILAGVSEDLGGDYQDGISLTRYNNTDDVGIDEFELNLKEIQVFPNPSHSYSNIKLSSPIQNGVLEIYSLGGQIVKKINAISGTEITFSTSEYSNGKYVLKIMENNIIVGKGELIVNH